MLICRAVFHSDCQFLMKLQVSGLGIAFLGSPFLHIVVVVAVAVEHYFNCVAGALISGIWSAWYHQPHQECKPSC